MKEFTQYEQPRKYTEEKNKQNFRNLWDNNKEVNVYIIRHPEEGGKESRAERIFKGMIALVPPSYISEK